MSPAPRDTALPSLQLAVALGTAVYMWNADSGDIQQLMECQDGNDYVTSVSWAGDGKHISVGTAGCQVRCLQPGGAAQHKMPLLVKVSSAAFHALLAIQAIMQAAKQPSISTSPAALSSLTDNPASSRSVKSQSGRPSAGVLQMSAAGPDLGCEPQQAGQGAEWPRSQGECAELEQQPAQLWGKGQHHCQP